MSADDPDCIRRLEELDALEAFYGEDVRVDNENRAVGPWIIKIASSVDLEIRLPARYPSQQPPIPCLHAPHYVVDDRRRKDIEAEMSDMYQEDTEVVIMWAEHARASLGDMNDLEEYEEVAPESSTATENTTQQEESSDVARVFHPHTSKFGQPVREFDEGIILNDSNKRVIHKGQPYHPPKSGSGETMIAHVASVESMDHVNWVLAELLLNDKKVAKASHNMIAYRFWDEGRGCLVSDNDDDGEKGAGAKLAALLEMADVRNVIVVVSRWYGGIHLGSSRFKYFASTARDALQEAGFIEKKK
jgi:hypothetical protein